MSDEKMKYPLLEFEYDKKLYEELSLEEENENRKTTQNDKIFVTSPVDFDDDTLMTYIGKASKLSPAKTRTFLKAVVPNYTGTDD